MEKSTKHESDNFDGPKQIVIPEQKYMSCFHCSHYSSNMVKSGRDPIYAHYCNHPDVADRIDFIVGNLHPNMAGVVETPKWCPFLKEKE